MNDLINRQTAINTLLKAYPLMQREKLVEVMETVPGTEAGDCISRQAAIEFIDYLLSQPCKEHIGDFVEGMRDGYYRIRSGIKYLPSAQCRTATWVKTEIGWKCSNCTLCTNIKGKSDFKYCPNCGADMRGESDENHNRI